ncbi:excinuclease ABC subunit UvrB [Candidatus Saccharibacteria bacterium]|nr:excinuclease ABC subunit UvrB [Candidatus Saccharibacteria bacterium]
MSDHFELMSKFSPTGDQPEAILALENGLKRGVREQTLKGVTGSGKTFTMANIIKDYDRPTLVLAHNKTLAAQLFSEFREFFPKNAVHYFVSYFDYYQPEAYIASTDTYIEKDSAINDEIDRLRHGATESLLSRRDVIIVASVSCIYGIGSPKHYSEMSLTLYQKDGKWGITETELVKQLVAMQYHRNDLAFERGNFRVMGDTVDLFPAAGETAYRFEFAFDELESVKIVDPLTLEVLENLDRVHIFPNTHYATPKEDLDRALVLIQKEFDERLKFFESHGKFLEAERLSQRTKYDLEMLKATGFVKGIENYSRHLEGRGAGEPPSTLLDFFPKDFLMLIDESHMTIPQVRGMYRGDHARKEALVEYGFRLPSALDNRPLTFGEFDSHINQVIYFSATPGEYELTHTKKPVEQIIRPTGLLDPEIEVRKTAGQVDDLIAEIEMRVDRHQRTLVTTLTKKMAEDLTDFLKERGIKTAYIHSDVDTLERGDILRDLRSGVYDVLVGINLLREGLDLPEVSLVAILDADKEGFLRSESALVQTIGRAARHVEGKVIMYADHVTESMDRAITETNRRRAIQKAYNEKHHITPTSVKKEISAGLRAIIPEKEQKSKLDLRKIPKDEYPAIVKRLKAEMELCAKNLEFERAALLRDQIAELEQQ